MQDQGHTEATKGWPMLYRDLELRLFTEAPATTCVCVDFSCSILQKGPLMSDAMLAHCSFVICPLATTD